MAWITELRKSCRELRGYGIVAEMTRFRMIVHCILDSTAVNSYGRGDQSTQQQRKRTSSSSSC
jgi:hypothetical protein